MKRLLCIVGRMDMGGAETFLMKMYRSLDKSKYQMDFCELDVGEGIYEKEIISLGGRIFHSTPKTKHIFKSFSELKNIIRNNNFKYVIRISQNSLSAIDLKAAKDGGAIKTIFRSSNTSTCGGTLGRILHKIMIPLSNNWSNIKIAPSTEAGLFMFGKKVVKNGGVVILPNALNTNDFKFNKELRDEYREKLGLKDKFIVGHIGRFSTQKNHLFLLNVFSEVLKVRPNSVLMLIGKGELENKIKDKVKELKIENNVLFMGVRKDIPELLFSMDIFLFPSFFEGMPNTVIEAQTSGLPCLISNSITNEALVTNLVETEKLNNSPKLWCDHLLELAKKNNVDNRINYAERMSSKGYDIKDCVKKFEEIIFE